ncbi:hypothetical protein B0H11DRAFT_2253113 [Mycena galericulata]|nr:hypothetical protein B0H11DRAFT_2253113 [Mycena galericulata]
MCNPQRLTTLLVVLTSLSAVHARFYTAPLRRQDSDETVTFAIDPSPTQTDASVASLYSVYSQACGPDLDSVAYAALPAFQAAGGATTVQITGDAFMEWIDENNGNWNMATAACDAADNALVSAQDAAPDHPNHPDTSVTTPATTAAPPGTTETPLDSGPSGTYSGPMPTVPPCLSLAGVTLGNCQSGTATQQAGQPGQPGGGGASGSVTETSAPSSPSKGSAAPAHRRASFLALVAAAGIALWN